MPSPAVVPPPPAAVGTPCPAPVSAAPAAPVSPSFGPTWLPIIRLQARGLRRVRLIAVYKDHIVTAICPRKFSFTETMLVPQGEAELTAPLLKLRRLDFADVTAVKITTHLTLRHFKLRARSGSPLLFDLPKAQAGHVEQFLRENLADRLPVEHVHGAHSLATGFLLLGLALIAVISVPALAQAGEDVLTFFTAIGAIVLVIAGLWLLVQHVRSRRRHDAAAQIPTRQAVTVAKLPLRSKPLGWTLKILGVGYWFLMLSPLADPLTDWLYAHLGSSASNVWWVLQAPAPLLIFAGYRLCQARYEPKAGGDSRLPVLFLRPFQDDEHTSLQPIGVTAQATGIRGRSMHVPSGQTDMVELVCSAHPIRMMRMLADYGASSSEESVARYFQKHGPVIAIGKPGERLASPGAARMYVDDAHWQETILYELQRAQAVVMQPAPSDGVRWELCHIRQLVNPHRVLFCLISYWRNPESFENLWNVVIQTMGVNLPRIIPYLPQPTFVYFDSQWNPNVQQMSYKDPLLWPITSDGADLHYSLAPFVEGMQTGKHQPPRPPRWTGGTKKWLVSGAAIVLGLILLVVPNALVSLSTRVFHLASGGLAGLSGPGLVARSAAKSSRSLLHGQKIAYQIESPDDMAAVPPDNAMVEQWRRTADGRFDFQIIVDPAQEDLSNLGQERVDANKPGAIGASLDSNGTVDAAGVTWVQAKIHVNVKEGVSVDEIDRAYSSPRGTVLIALHIVSSPDSDAVYEKLADEILASFQFTDAAGK